MPFPKSIRDCKICQQLENPKSKKSTELNRQTQFCAKDLIAQRPVVPILHKNHPIVGFARPHLKMSTLSTDRKLAIPSAGRQAIKPNPVNDKKSKIVPDEKQEQKLRTGSSSPFSLRSLIDRQSNPVLSISRSGSDQQANPIVKLRSSHFKTEVCTREIEKIEGDEQDCPASVLDSPKYRPSPGQSTISSKNSATTLPKASVPDKSIAKKIYPKQYLNKSPPIESALESSSRIKNVNEPTKRTTSSRRRNLEIICTSCKNVIQNQIDQKTEEELAALSEAIGKCRLRIQNSKETHENQQMDLLEINEVLDFEQKEIDERQKRLAAYVAIFEERSLQAKNLETEINSLTLKTMKESRGRHCSASLSKECIPNCLMMETCEEDSSEFQKQVTELMEEMNRCVANGGDWNSETFAEKLEAIWKNNTVESNPNLKGKSSRSTSEPRVTRSNKFQTQI